MSTWGAAAQRILNGMVASGVKVNRTLLGPGPSVGRGTSQFLVYPDFPSSPSQGFQTLPAVGCTRVLTVQFRAVYTKDCVPPPKDNGDQPDPAATSKWVAEYLDECERVANGILDAFDPQEGVTINPGQFTGPAGGVASMSLPVLIGPALLG